MGASLVSTFECQTLGRTKWLIFRPLKKKIKK